MRKIEYIVMLLTFMLCLCACMPGDYSDDLLKKTKEEYLEKGKAWFSAELPDAKIVTMDYYYSGSSLYDLVQGSMKLDGETFGYYLNPDSGVLFTERYMEQIEALYLGELSRATGLSKEAFSYFHVAGEMVYHALPGDSQKDGQPPCPEIEEHTMWVAMMPWEMTEAEAEELALSLPYEDIPGVLTDFHVEVKDLEEAESFPIEIFEGLTGFSDAELQVTEPGEEGKDLVYEIRNQVEEGKQVLQLTKRKRTLLNTQVIREAVFDLP